MFVVACAMLSVSAHYCLFETVARRWLDFHVIAYATVNVLLFGSHL